MKRICPIVAFALVFAGTQSDAQDKPGSVRVTGVVQLPAGANLPTKASVVVEIYKIEPGKVITFYKAIGRYENYVVKTPLQFAVPCASSYLKDMPPANSFALRAKVYDMSSGRKLLYETPREEALQPFTDGGQPKQNLTVPVQAPVPK